MFILCLLMCGIGGSMLVCHLLEHPVAFVVYRLTGGELPYKEWKKEWDL